MLAVLLLLFALVSQCVAIHGLGMVLFLRWMRYVRPDHQHHFSLPAMYWILVRLVFGLLILHLMQIAIWALCYFLLDCFPDIQTAFYYSASSYSTVGYGDVHPPEQWRVLGSVEAVTGVLMFGWSTGLLFTMANYLMERFRR